MLRAGLFILGALALIGIGALFLRHTTSLARVGGKKYEWRRRRRVIGKVFMVAAGILFVVAGMILYYPPVDPSETASAGPMTATPSTPDQHSTAPAPTPDTNAAPLSSIILSPPPPTNLPAAESSPPPSAPSAPDSDSPGARLFAEADQLNSHNDFAGALVKVNAALAADPKMAISYFLRATIYVQTKQYDKAESDFVSGLQLDPKNAEAKYNLAQVEFLQQKYDAARDDFAALQQNAVMGDLATYKVFLCDLLGGRHAAAAKELDAFNQVGSNASYYFANMAWALYNKKFDEAHDWENSAERIYSPEKFNLYADSLHSLPQPPAAGAPGN